MSHALKIVRKHLPRCARIGTILALAVLIPFTVLTARAGGVTVPPVVLTDAQSEYSVAPNLEILRDPTRQLTIQDVSSPAFSAQFVPNQQKIPNVGLTTDAVWVRLRVQNRGTAANHWLLALHEPRLGQVELYLPTTDGNYRVKHTGRDLPFTSRDIPHRDFVFDLDLPVGAEQTVYLRLESSTPMLFPLSIWTAEALAQRDQSDLLLNGLFYGAMLIMAGYNLFLFFSLRDRTYLYLALFILSYSLNQAARDGLAHQYLYPNLSNRFVVELSLAVFMIFLILFSMGILETRARIPRLHRLLMAVVVTFLIVFLLTPFMQLNAVGLILTQASAILLGFAAYLVWRQGYRPTRLYLISWLLFFVTGFLYIVNNFALLPDFSFPENPPLVAVVFAVLLGSLALADRVNLLESEAAKANRELERSERKYHSLFDNSRDGIFITTREGMILDVNPRLLAMFGVMRSNLVHMDAMDFYFNPAERAAFLKTIDERGFVQDYEVQLRRHDGSPMTALVSATTWEDPQSDLLGYQGVIRDVTEQYRMEQELAQQRAQREQAIVEERGRLARELHDSVTQSLYSIGLYANAAALALRVDKTNVGADHVKQIIQLGLEAMVDMRSLIFELRPPALEKVGLASALEARLQAVEGRAGVAVEFHSAGKDELPLPVQTELYRIAQEALNNVVKHAHAKHVVVNLSFASDCTELEIRDDGDGIDLASAQQQNTMGLSSIAERAQKINGMLTVEGKPGQGTVVRVEVPHG